MQEGGKHIAANFKEGNPILNNREANFQRGGGGESTPAPKKAQKSVLICCGNFRMCWAQLSYYQLTLYRNGLELPDLATCTE